MFHVVIPARHAATRLPGKPLLDIGGKPLVQWVWERSRLSGATGVIIATDDQRILAAAQDFGAEALMTSADHASGTDRVAEVARLRQMGDEDIVVNVQGDEPLIEPRLIADLAAALAARPGTDIATAVAPVRTLDEFLDPNHVKAVLALDGRALYFSRAPLPWPRDDAPAARPARFSGAWRHIGIYAYRVRSLRRFATLPPTPLELTEKLEQLRALENGMTIHCVALSEAPPAGVDTPHDLERIRARLGGP